MDLNDRKRKILQAIIDEYIGTAECRSASGAGDRREKRQTDP